MMQAVIDIGTNSTRLLVADAEGGIKRVEKLTRITRLGRGVDSERRLSESAVRRNMEVLLEYRDIAQSYGITSLRAIATSAVRDASNRDEFVKAVKEETGINVDIISGREEAELGYLGASSVRPGEKVLVVDIGGGSTELVWGGCGGVEYSISMDIGAVRATERFFGPGPITADTITEGACCMEEMVREAFKGSGKGEGYALVGIGGTITTLAAIDQVMAEYDRDRVHGYVLKRDRAGSILKRLMSTDVEGRKLIPGLQSGRADIIPAGALILKTILDVSGSDCITVSESDNLEGSLIKRCELF
jgi:exopolyphosphatase/guanosine-5'-triphosphate,3'-diphosphate pyrophosphatase